MRAVTYLGDNTLPILEALCAHLRGRGVDVVFDSDAPRSSTEARRNAERYDLVWACGYLTAALLADGSLAGELAGAPVFAGESAPVYRSVVVARDDGPSCLAELAALRGAINEADSWSGHLGLRAELSARGLDGRVFAEVITTGAHRESVAAVASGAADAAAIDATVWNHLVRSGEAPDGVRVIDTTGDWPAPPFTVTERVAPGDRAVLVDALRSVGSGDVAGLERIDPADTELYVAMLRR